MMSEERLLKIILLPHASEKAMRIKEGRQYVFRVLQDATKPEIKEAIQYLFKVDIESVTIVNVKPKKRRFRNILGMKKGWKKAYITLAENQAIEYAGA